MNYRLSKAVAGNFSYFSCISPSTQIRQLHETTASNWKEVHRVISSPKSDHITDAWQPVNILIQCTRLTFDVVFDSSWPGSKWVVRVGQGSFVWASVEEGPLLLDLTFGENHDFFSPFPYQMSLRSNRSADWILPEAKKLEIIEPFFDVMPGTSLFQVLTVLFVSL